MKTTLLLAALLLGGCYVDPRSMEACAKMCGVNGVRKVSQDTCECGLGFERCPQPVTP